MTSNPLAYRIDEAAEMASISRRMIYSLIAKGKLKTIKIGGCRRVPAKALHALIENGVP
jgi:excisionase family DNA binding protein